MEMTIPLYVLAVALPMIVLTRLSKRVFFQLHSKCKVGSFRGIYCSFPVSVNTCLASEPYSLPMVSLEILQSGWFHECIYTRRNNKGGGFTVYMRKLAPASVSYRGDFLILYRVYMMMGHFMSRLFEGTLHVDKIPVRLKIAKIAHALPVPDHRQTDFTPKWVVVSCLHDTVTKFRTGVKFSPWYNSRGELTPEWLAPAWHCVSCKQI